MEIFTIAMDGPAGSGKSTIAKIIAKKLNIVYLDTGAMYRAVGYYSILNNVDIEHDKTSLINLLESIQMSVIHENQGSKIIINGIDTTPHLREADVSWAASAVAVIPEVREKLVALQREIGKATSVVMDGRDIGTFVFPDAKYKFYIIADIETRAQRRFLEYSQSDKEITLEQIQADIKKRDYNDSNRDCSPLKQADDAIVLDTTNITIDQSVDFILQRIGM